ncbi:hypothetical protein ES703_59100 [subsurface metagenome]
MSRRFANCSRILAISLSKGVFGSSATAGAGAGAMVASVPGGIFHSGASGTMAVGARGAVGVSAVGLAAVGLAAGRLADSGKSSL